MNKNNNVSLSVPSENKKNIQIKEYTQWLQKRNLSPKTIRVYLWAIREYKEQELNTNNIEKFFKENLNKYEPNALRIQKSVF